MNSPTPELTIVIPAYNEQDRLPPTLARVRAWIDAAKISTEVIVVDDGSQDFTAAVVANLSADWPELRSSSTRAITARVTACATALSKRAAA